MHELPDDGLIALLVEETGQPHDSNSVKLTFAAIKHLKAFADFRSAPEINVSLEKAKPESLRGTEPKSEVPAAPQNFGLNIGYTINLNLPATSDPEVFDAIFKSLKQHLLRPEDA